MKKTYIPSSDSGNRLVNGNGGSLRHLNFNGRAIPSKWEDAERWITSPLSGHEISRYQRQRRKSKSGPLSHGYSSSSPGMPFLEHGRSSLQQSRGGSPPPETIERSSSFPDKSPLRSYQGRNPRISESPEETLDRTISHQISEPTSHVQRSDVRDVQVDARITSKRQDRKKIESMWDLEAGTKNISSEREDAKINAWERLQKAKAEAAIRKLEVKLEKRKTIEMEKILNKLKMAEIRARQMRETVTKSGSAEAPKTPRRLASFIKVAEGGWGCFSFHSV